MILLVMSLDLWCFWMAEEEKSVYMLQIATNYCDIVSLAPSLQSFWLGEGIPRLDEEGQYLICY